MKAQQHTPGPWIQSGKGVWVETYPGVGGPDPQPPEGEQIGEFNTEADAKLGAKAPEMAARIKELEAEVRRLQEEAVTVDIVKDEWRRLRSIEAEAMAQKQEDRDDGRHHA